MVSVYFSKHKASRFAKEECTRWLLSCLFLVARNTIRCFGHQPLCVCRIVDQMKVTYHGETKMASKHLVAPNRFAVMVSVLFAFAQWATRSISCIIAGIHLVARYTNFYAPSVLIYPQDRISQIQIRAVAQTFLKVQYARVSEPGLRINIELPCVPVLYDVKDVY